MKNKKQFWDNIVVLPNGCWKWIGVTHPKGYGNFSVKNKTEFAHRRAYKMYYLELKDSDDVHHECRFKPCICPLHLKAEPHDNHSDSASGGNKTKTHCINGHEFTNENTYLRKVGTKTHRMCKRCRREGMCRSISSGSNLNLSKVLLSVQGVESSDSVSQKLDGTTSTVVP